LTAKLYDLLLTALRARWSIRRPHQALRQTGEKRVAKGRRSRAKLGKARGAVGDGEKSAPLAASRASAQPHAVGTARAARADDGHADGHSRIQFLRPGWWAGAQGATRRRGVLPRNVRARADECRVRSDAHRCR